MLAPGFRFHPTDEELVRYYLRRKVCGKGFRVDAISEIDVYKVEPWDLPSFSKLKSRDLEWYFFSVLDKKYANGAKTNRATENGYWKTTGKDRAVYHKSQMVGMKKTLVYHSGRAPKGLRSNWVMHEYRLVDMELERAGIAQDSFVLCRVFQKSGSGPKNGEQYGAPFVQEEWEDDELELVPKVEPESGDDMYLDGPDLEQILRSDVPSSTSLPLNLHSADGSYGEGTSESVDDTPKLTVDANEHYCEPEGNIRVVKLEYIGESSKSENPVYVDYLLDEPYFDTSDNLLQGNGGFIESSNLSNPIESKPFAFDTLEEHCTFLGAHDDCAQHFGYYISTMLQNDDAISHQVSLPLKDLNDETEESTLPSKQPCDVHNKNNTASTSTSTSTSDTLDSATYEPEFQYPLSKQASHMLCPSKDSALHIGSLSQPSSSVHVTAGMIQITNLTTTGGSWDQSLHKPEQFKILISFRFSQDEDGCIHLGSNISGLPRKTDMILSRGVFYLILYCAVILYTSFKIGACIYAK